MKMFHSLKMKRKEEITCLFDNLIEYQISNLGLGVSCV